MHIKKGENIEKDNYKRRKINIIVGEIHLQKKKDIKREKKKKKQIEWYKLYM